jgi:hypothetical protein
MLTSMARILTKLAFKIIIFYASGVEGQLPSDTLAKLTSEIIIFYARGVEGQLPNGTLAKFCQKKKRYNVGLI